MTPPPRLSTGARIAAAGIVVVAAALRIWNTDAGIPHAVGPDEPQVMNRVSEMMRTGDFNPHFFDWPSLTFYLHLVVACFTYLSGAMRGAWSSLDQVGSPELYHTARQFAALIGASAVALTFAAGRRWGTGTALLASGLLAVLPPHVRESHYVLTDVPASALTALALLMALRAYERQTRASWCWAGLAVGLAASAKYHAAAAIVFPIIGVLASGGGVTVMTQRLLMIAGLAAAGFLAGTPYAVLDLPKFLADYGRLAANFARDRGGEPGWSIYLKHLLHGMAWPAFVAAMAGVALAMRSALFGPGRVRAWMAVVFTGVFFTVMARSYQIYGRYMLPLYPVLCILAAHAVTEVARLAGAALAARPARHWITAGAAAVILAVPSVKAVDFNLSLGKKSTVDLTMAWFRASVPEGARVAVEEGAVHLPQPFDTVWVRQLTELTVEEYAAGGVRYLLAASPMFHNAMRDPDAHRDDYIAYRRLLSETREVAAFDPGPDTPGPAIRIFEFLK